MKWSFSLNLLKIRPCLYATQIMFFFFYLMSLYALTRDTASSHLSNLPVFYLTHHFHTFNLQLPSLQVLVSLFLCSFLFFESVTKTKYSHWMVIASMTEELHGLWNENQIKVNFFLFIKACFINKNTPSCCLKKLSAVLQ